LINYLGILIDKKLNYSRQVNFTAKKAKTARAILYPVVNAKSPLPINTKLHIYRTCIRSILTYAVVVWTASLSKASWNILEEVNNAEITLKSPTVRK